MESPTDWKKTEIAEGLIGLIRGSTQEEVRIMQACGTMAANTLESGVHEVLPPNISLIAGPGHPACVPTTWEIDKAIGICRDKSLIIAAFEDVLRVPGSSSSLATEMAGGAGVRPVNSSIEAVQIAAENKDKKVVLIGSGFEATVPTVAAAILEARRRGIKNFLVFSLLRLLVPALDAVLGREGTHVDAVLCPPHISGIIGSNGYIPLAERHGTPFVVSGFEPVDILRSVSMILEQMKNGQVKVETQCKNSVTSWGNRNALSAMDRVFRPSDCQWRGIGAVPKSGLRLRLEFNSFNAEIALGLHAEHAEDDPQCVCGDILRGEATPLQCSLFGGKCDPEHPIGPSMAPPAGLCAAFQKHYAKELSEAPASTK